MVMIFPSISLFTGNYLFLSHQNELFCFLPPDLQLSSFLLSQHHAFGKTPAYSRLAGLPQRCKDQTCLSPVCTHQPQGTYLAHRGCQALQRACIKKQIIPFWLLSQLWFWECLWFCLGSGFGALPSSTFGRRMGFWWCMTLQLSAPSRRCGTGWAVSRYERGLGSLTLVVLLLPCSRPVPTVGLEVIFYDATEGPIYLGKMNYQSRCYGYCLR